MSPAHLHLLLNHVPVLGTAFGLLTAWTASEGGQVRHSEIRPQAAQVPMTEVKDRD